MTCGPCSRAGRGQALGDDTLTSILTSLPGGAPGAPAGIDAPALLTTQVNRFTGAGVPDTLRVADQAFPVVSGKISPAIAEAALVILVARAQASLLQFDDPGSSAQLTDAISHMADPVPYVMGNLPFVSGTIQQFGDAAGLPKASLVGALSKAALVIAGGVVGLGVLLVMRASRSRKSRKA
jgi:hypothetical protein